MSALRDLVAEELKLPVDPRVREIAAAIAARHGHAARAVLFYGSCLRQEQLDGLMRSKPTLKAKKERHFEDQMQALFRTLTMLYPDPARRKGLQIVAMVSIGCLKIAVETWLGENGRRSITTCLDEAFAALKTEI